MGKIVQAIRGMNDCLPTQSPLWKKVEYVVESVISTYGYSEIRTPIVEMTHLFKHAIGGATDVVEKEMYTFDDSGYSLTLRPEGTAGCVRSAIENGFSYNQVQRLWYTGPMFRHERPQKGRYRQFHQCGVEVFGLCGPDVDAELIMMTARLWQELGIHDHLHLKLSSIGSSVARARYRVALTEFLEKYKEVLDEDARRRMYLNPMRVLDTKNPRIRSLLSGAPRLGEYLDVESKKHLLGLCSILDEVGIAYTIDEYLVRGLDYYNRTVFEWTTDSLGSQGTICGGGRYDGLFELLGGKATPAIGFAIGLERLVLMMKHVEGLQLRRVVDVYIMTSGKDTMIAGVKLAEQLRQEVPGLRVINHCGGGKFRTQFKYADKVGAAVAVVLGENELATHSVVVKNLALGDQVMIPRKNLFSHLAALI